MCTPILVIIASSVFETSCGKTNRRTNGGKIPTPATAVDVTLYQQVSATADRPARRSASGPPCCTAMSTVNVINWRPRLSPVYHTLTVQLSWQHSRDQPFKRRGWCPPKFKWFTWPNYAPYPFREGCHPWDYSTCYTVNLPNKFEVSISTHYEDVKGDTKCQNRVVSG